MRSFSLHPIVLFALIALAAVSGLLLLVAAPIAFINWLWNVSVAACAGLPAIGFFQAALLYVAMICLLYISDVIHVEFKAEKLD